MIDLTEKQGLYSDRVSLSDQFGMAILCNIHGHNRHSTGLRQPLGCCQTGKKFPDYELAGMTDPGLASSQSILSFLPVRLLERLHGAGGFRPTACDFPAAVLYLDISRYSTIVEQMVHRGKEGFERIPDFLDRSYARCVEHVNELGGEVAQFAGDSLVAYWASEMESLEDALAAASECAKRICAGDLRNNVGEMASFHAGIGAGTLWSAAVGGVDNHWNLLLGGPALRRAAAAHARARPGSYEILVETKDNIARNRLAVVEVGRSAVLGGPKASPPLKWMAEFLPARFDHILRPVSGVGTRRDRIAALDALTEFRPVTVLFARVDGLDETHRDALMAHQSLCEDLQWTVTSHDGPAGELLIDDKGLVFHTVFGEPGTFHKDDPVRALNAAIDIMSVISDHGWTGSVGVASGEALFRAVGPRTRRVFMALGAPMNRAARLMSSGGEGVLCDGPTQRADRNRFFDFLNIGQLKLTGMGQMASVFRPSRKAHVVQLPAKRNGGMIGRQIEIEWMVKVLDESQLGHRRLIVVAGEAGIGKSRLLESFLQATCARGRLTCLARIERSDRQRLLAPWRTVLESLLEQQTEATPGDLVSRLRERFAGRDELVQRLPLLASLLSVGIENTETTEHLLGANRADATMRFVVDLVEALAPRGFVIALDDCQWMDSASWRVAEWLVRRLPSLLLIMTIRQEEGPSEYRSLRQRIEEERFHAPDVDGDSVARAARVLDLERLSDEAIRELLVQTLDGLPVADEVGHTICGVARGNPLFAEESALALRGDGLIAILNGQWRASQSVERLERDRLERFDAIERVVRERVDRLDPAEQLVVKAAAVIGRTFDAHTLEILLGTDFTGPDVDAHLSALKARRLVVDLDPSARVFQFRHDYTRDVVYDAIPAAVRQELHRRLANWLEEPHRDGMPRDLASLVLHWEAAGDSEKAVAYADAAAAESLRSGAYREAEEFLNLCIAHARKQDGFAAIRRIQWQRGLAEAHYGRGNLAGVGDATQRALTLAKRPLPASRPGVLGRLAVEMVRTLSQQVWPRLFAPVQAGEGRNFQLELARCNSQAAIFYYFRQDMLRCLLASLAAVNAGDRCGPGPELVRAYAQIGCAAGIRGYSGLADHFLGKAEKAAATEGNPTVLAYALLLDALYQIGHGAWDPVARNLDRSQELCTAAGDHLNWCNAQAVRFWMYSYQGQRPDAEKTADVLLSTAQNSGNIQQEIWALRCKALCALAADRPRHATDLLRTALAALPKSADVSELIASRGCLALALTRSGEHRDGIQEAVATAELFSKRKRPTVHSTLDGSSAVAEVFLRGRQEGISKDYSEWAHWEAITLTEIDRHRRAFPVASARYGLWKGLAALLDGRRREAIQTWTRAMEVAQHMGLRQDEAFLAAELRFHGEA